MGDFAGGGAAYFGRFTMTEGTGNYGYGVGDGDGAGFDFVVA